VSAPPVSSFTIASKHTRTTGESRANVVRIAIAASMPTACWTGQSRPGAAAAGRRNRADWRAGAALSSRHARQHRRGCARVRSARRGCGVRAISRHVPAPRCRAGATGSRAGTNRGMVGCDCIRPIGPAGHALAIRNIKLPEREMTAPALIYAAGATASSRFRSAVSPANRTARVRYT